MIKIAEEGNVTIRTVTGGVKAKGGAQWTVYPSPDPSVEPHEREQKNLLRELSITDFREKEDLSGQRMREDMAEAIARIRRNLGNDRYKDLGLKADRIDVDPEGKIAGILEEKYEIRPIESESPVPPEMKG